MCDGDDYIEHWDAGSYSSLSEAYDVWCRWWPDMDEVREAVKADMDESGKDVTEYDLQIGIWDEHGNECEFHSEGIRI